MPDSGRWLGCLLVLLLASGLSSAGGPAFPVGEPLATGLILEDILEASALPHPPERDRLRESLQTAIETLANELGRGAPTYRKGRRLHRALHDRHLLRYDPGADELQDILRDGRFNCLSATLFYGLVARELGYEVQVVESPGHLFLRILLGRRVVDVESTSPRGYDRFHSAFATLGAEADTRPLARGPATLRVLDSRDSLWPVSLEESAGFAWLNSAWRSLQEGRPVRAAELVLRAHGFLPGLVAKAQGVRRLLYEAFTTEYEAGRFENAYRIAAVEVSLHPSSTTARDRVLASAIKSIEALCEADAPGSAEIVLSEVAAMGFSPDDLARLERGACPLIAAAAVRLGDWALARRAAERFAVAERDHLEAARLLAWVHERSSAPSLPADPACMHPGPGRPATGLPR